MKDEIKHGDILHCRGKRWISRMIMRFTKSRWSHTALVLEFGSELFIIDAQKDGVNVRPFDAWHSKYGYQIEVSRPDMNHHATPWCTRALSKIGVTAYDFEGLLLRQPWALLTGQWRNRGEKEDDKMYCSEFVSWCYYHPEFYKMTPEAVYDWCQSKSFQTITRNF